jgi:integrase
VSIEEIGPRTFRVRAQWRDPKTGRKRSATGIHEGDRRGAKALLSKLRSDGRSASDKAKRQRLDQYAKSWMRSRVLRIKPSTATRYASALDKHILPALGDYWLDKLDRDDVQAYVNARTEAGAEGGTVLNELRVLRTMARDAVADKLCATNWADRVTPPKVRTWTEERPNLFTAPQLAGLLSAVPRQWLAAVTLSAFTGLRWGEMSALRWSDLDVEAGAIRVRRANWRGHIGDPKTKGSHRTVALPPVVVAMLAVSGKGKPSALLFPNRFGKVHKGWPLVKVMKRACLAADVPYTTPHGLRRTFNNLARKVVSGMVVKSITGHTTDAMLEHYSQVSLDEKTGAMRLVMELVDATTTLAADPKDAPNGARMELSGGDDGTTEGENAEK